MKIVALLSFYDEPDRWLRNLPVSLKKTKVTHLVALDGAYSRFPDGKAESPKSNHEALHEGCAAANIELTLAVPNAVWAGDEVQKRTELFRIAETLTTEDDWYMVIDGDTFVEKPDKKLPEKLANTRCDAAFVRLMQGTTVQASEFRALFRALRGLHCDTNHFTYRAGDGRYLWASASHLDKLEPALHTNVVFQHMNLKRPPSRNAAAKSYYDTRHAQRTEYGKCEYCKTEQATLKVVDDWYWDAGQLKGMWFEACERCASTLGTKLKDKLVGIGAKPEVADMVLEQLWR